MFSLVRPVFILASLLVPVNGECDSSTGTCPTAKVEEVNSLLQAKVKVAQAESQLAIQNKTLSRSEGTSKVVDVTEAFVDDNLDDNEELVDDSEARTWFCVANINKKYVKGPFASIGSAKAELNSQKGSSRNRQMICEMTSAGAKADPHVVGGENQGACCNKWWYGWGDIRRMNSMCEKESACKEGPQAAAPTKAPTPPGDRRRPPPAQAKTIYTVVASNRRCASGSRIQRWKGPIGKSLLDCFKECVTEPTCVYFASWPGTGQARPGAENDCRIYRSPCEPYEALKPNYINTLYKITKEATTTWSQLGSSNTRCKECWEGTGCVCDAGNVADLAECQANAEAAGHTGLEYDDSRKCCATFATCTALTGTTNPFTAYTMKVASSR